MDTSCDVAIVGGGQLGRMITEENVLEGCLHHITVLDPTPTPCPASAYADKHIQGSFTDEKQIARLVDSDVITYELEPIAIKTLLEFERQRELGQPGPIIRPGAKILEVIQDKFRQYEHFTAAGIPIPYSKLITSTNDLENVSSPQVLKSCFGSYDGNGNKRYDGSTSPEETFNHFKGDFFAQEQVDFEKELAVIVARDIHGRIILYDCTETIQENDRLAMSITPARLPRETRWQAMLLAKEAVNSFDNFCKEGYVGVAGVELFYESDGTISLNEFAPRVHNSGHWTMDGTASTSQFAQHLRLITGQRVSDTVCRSPVVMVNLIGEAMDYEQIGNALDGLSKDIQSFVHVYDKRPRGKITKQGHVNFVSTTDIGIERLVEEAQRFRERVR